MESSINVYLSEELIREIVLRLHVKGLIRCKCVCKEWRALIGSQSFIDAHFSHGSNQDNLVLQYDRMKEIHSDFMSYAEFAKPRDEFVFHVYDERHMQCEAANYLFHTVGDMWFKLVKRSANEINRFCVVRQGGRVALLDMSHLCKLKPLPPIPLPEAELSDHDLSYGFVFDRFSRDYKVVAFQKNGEEDRFIYVYSSRSDSWRRTEVVDSLDAKVGMANRGVHNVALNKAYHWLLSNHDKSKSILAFDMRSKYDREILVPDLIRDTKSQLLVVYMTAYGDSSTLSFTNLPYRRFVYGNI